MPHTPLSPGEPVAGARDAVLRHIDCDEAPRSSRRPATWQDLAWVGFDETAGSSAPPPVPAVERPADLLSAPSLAAGDRLPPLPKLRLDPDDAWETPPTQAPEAARRVRRRPRAEATVARVTRRVMERVKSVSAGITRVLRLALAAALMGAVAVFAYQGGEQLAELVGPPSLSGNAPAHPAIALAAPEAERPAPKAQSAPTFVTDNNAEPAPDGPAARYLDRAKAGDAGAQYNLAVLYVRGDGVPRDLSRAADWFRRAAAAGNVDAEYNLAVMYERGLGVEQNAVLAVRWYGHAAAQNHASAQYNLGLAYAEGRGVARDPMMAATWYRQAAAQRLLPAMLNLAILYDKGEGVSRSLINAYAWYRAAARGGDAVAAKRAQEVFDALSGPEKGNAVIAAASVVEMIDRKPSVPAQFSGARRDAPSAIPVRTALPGQPKG